MAVLARDLDPYQPLIDMSFPEHGLGTPGGASGYFVDRRRSAEHHPLLAFVRSLFQIALGRGRMPAVIAFLKTGLAGVTLLEADEIENYLIQHRLRGAAWDDPAEWAYQRQMTVPSEEAPPLEVFRGCATSMPCAAASSAGCGRCSKSWVSRGRFCFGRLRPRYSTRSSDSTSAQTLVEWARIDLEAGQPGAGGRARAGVGRSWSTCSSRWSICWAKSRCRRR